MSFLKPIIVANSLVNIDANLKKIIMIKREKYLKALDIIEAYHKQLNLQIVKCSFSKIKDLQETDFVKCMEVDTNTKKYLTVGREYQILRFSEGKYKFTITDDNGKEKSYVTDRCNVFKAVKRRSVEEVLAERCQQYMTIHLLTFDRISNRTELNPFPIGKTSLANLIYKKKISLAQQKKLAEFFNLTLKVTIE